MLFKKYHIVIFKDREGHPRNLKLRGWLGVTLFLVIAGLVAINVYLWEYYTSYSALENELKAARRIIHEQNSQLLALSVRVDELADNLQRVQKFDSRLRVLLNVDKNTDGEAFAEITEAPFGQNALFGGSRLLLQHRELFTRQAFSVVNDLNSNVGLEEVTQQKLLLYMRDNKEMMLSIPSIWPATGRLTSPFGFRSSPFTNRRQGHKGIDIANKIGTPIWASAKGTVVFAGNESGYGRSIQIDHGNNIVTRYAHLNTILVKEGQIVKRGEVIGTMGNSGRTTGSHLHYEVRLSGIAVNPLKYILN